jgi:hypothetical protein
MRFFILIFIFFIWIEIPAQEFNISINKLTEETQKLSESPDNLKLVWWIPVEFWQAVFAQDQTMPQAQADEIVQVLGQYTILATLDGKIGAFGDITYETKDNIFKTLEIIDTNNKTYKPLEDSEIDNRTQEILSFMKPVLGNTLGNMGENMHFFLFKDQYNPSERIINPKNKDNFTVKLGDEEFRWTLPLASLIKPKKCPVDDELMNGTWNYCPHHGAKLKEQ